LVLLIILMGLGILWQRRRQARQETRINQLFSISDLTNSLNLKRNGKHAGNRVDAVFVLPDISNYTQFVMSDHLPPEQAQDVIFSLMSAIMKAASKTLNFSKMEGDAALFYANTEEVKPIKFGKTVSAILNAFDHQKAALLQEYGQREAARKLIEQLDLKIFIHQGSAQRFTYRGTVDHFGSEVTLLHKLMKNRVSLKRYVLVTKAAASAVRLDNRFVGSHYCEVFGGEKQVSTMVFTEKAEVPKKSNLTSGSISGSRNSKKWNLPMKIKTLATVTALAVWTTTAFAADYTKGTVKKIDTRSGKITVKHEELKNLDMPAMTMVFRAKDESVMNKLKEGKNIEFIAERVKGKLTLVEVK